MGIKGITVTLYEKTASGVDDFNRAVFSVNEVSVDNVLVGNGVGSSVIDATNLNGKADSWTIAIPKGDTHNWLDSDIEFDLAGHHKVHTYGAYTEGIESMIPLSWHRQIKAEEYG